MLKQLRLKMRLPRAIRKKSRKAKTRYVIFGEDKRVMGVINAYSPSQAIALFRKFHQGVYLGDQAFAEPLTVFSPDLDPSTPIKDLPFRVGDHIDQLHFGDLPGRLSQSRP